MWIDYDASTIHFLLALNLEDWSVLLDNPERVVFPDDSVLEPHMGDIIRCPSFPAHHLLGFANLFPERTRIVNMELSKPGH